MTLWEAVLYSLIGLVLLALALALFGPEPPPPDLPLLPPRRP